MKNNILLVGLGNIGSRHLESLEKLPKKFIIYIHDQNKIKLNRFKKNINFNFVSNLDLIKKLCFKVCIIATTASLRKNLIKKICGLASVKHWIVEKPIEQSLKNLKIINQITKKNIWVNTPRRSFIFYKNLKKKIGRKISHVYLSGNIEIACNSIHFIDIVSFLINSDVKKIITSNLNKKWRQSKRKGFVDVFGKLIIFYKNGVVFTINAFKKNNINFEKNYTLKIFTKKNEKYEINETRNLVSKSSKIKKTKILQYQSKITKKFVMDLLNYNRCELPKLNKVICNHQILLSSLIRHYNACYKKKINSIKIT